MIRNYNCKNEELSVVGNFVLLSLKRDLAEFTAFSPRFNDKYVTGFETSTATVNELVEPKSETKILKGITERLYANMAGLITLINHLTGYIELADGGIELSAADFGLADLRKGIIKRDPESVLRNLQTVNTNIIKYKEVLTAMGMSEPLITKFTEAYTVISDDKLMKHKIMSNRTALVQSNLGMLNEFYDQITEICKIGKILYKPTDQAKLKDYTFSHLMKQVRQTTKSKEVAPVQ